jgi:hypothetical protein
VGQSGIASDENNLLLRILAESPQMGMYDYLLPPEYTDVIPFLWNGFDASVGYTYQIGPAPVEQWQSEMTKSHRKDLRRAQKAMEELNGTIEVDGSPEEFFGIVMNTVVSKNFRFGMDMAMFLKLWNALCERQAGTIYIFRDGSGKAITGTLVVRDW